MKITFTKQITLHSATVYMKIKKDVLRNDIQEYLNGKRFDNDLVNNRINNYLKEIHIYGDNNCLTKLGETVKATGYLPTLEEGRYKIWYTQNDEYFGNVIMYFRREAPSFFAKNRVTELNVYFNNDGHFLMPARDREEIIDYTNFSLLETQLNGEIIPNPDTVTANLTMEDDKETYCTFSGIIVSNIVKECIEIELNNKKINRNEKIKDSITEILPDYDSDYKRLRVIFDGNKKFVSQQHTCKWRGFSGTINSVNLMPFDLGNAKKWRDSLVRDIVAEQYLSPQDFQSKVIEVNDELAFEKYRNNLDVPESKDFKTKIGGVEYWHLNAPIDLNPNNLFTNINEIITLQKSDKISFAEIVSRLGVASENDVVIYYDKYITNERQQKAASALMESINATKKVIVTDMSPQNMKSNYIEKYRKNIIRMRDLNQGIFSKHPSHDRYLIVGDKYWSITNSIDFIRFSERDITKDTQGTVIQNVTFTPISILDKELLNFVNTEKNGR